MNRYIILHRIKGEDFPRPVVIRSDSIMAVDGLEDGNTRIFFGPHSYWTVAEDDSSILTALGFFAGEASMSDALAWHKQRHLQDAQTNDEGDEA